MESQFWIRGVYSGVVSENAHVYVYQRLLGWTTGCTVPVIQRNYWNAFDFRQWTSLHLPSSAAGLVWSSQYCASKSCSTRKPVSISAANVPVSDSQPWPVTQHSPLFAVLSRTQLSSLSTRRIRAPDGGTTTNVSSWYEIECNSTQLGGKNGFMPTIPNTKSARDTRNSFIVWGHLGTIKVGYGGAQEEEEAIPWECFPRTTPALAQVHIYFASQGTVPSAPGWLLWIAQQNCAPKIRISDAIHQIRLRYHNQEACVRSDLITLNCVIRIFAAELSRIEFVISVISITLKCFLDYNCFWGYSCETRTIIEDLLVLLLLLVLFVFVLIFPFVE